MTSTSAVAAPLRGTKVLVVEDEFYLAMDIKEEVERAGGSVLGPCPDSETTIAVIEKSKPDSAIVDINLGRGSSFEVAEELLQRNVPFVFLTGYDANSIPAGLLHIQRFEKPAELTRVLEAVRRLPRY